jgi:hypothetical protein
MWQQQINKTDAEKRQKSLSNDLLHSQLSLEYVKGQLSAIGMLIGKHDDKMALAIEKMAQSSYQTTITTNKQICSSTMDLVKRIHTFAHNRREKNDQIFYRQFNEPRSAVTKEERDKIWQQQTVQLMQQSNNDNYEFRTTILGEAIYLKDELLKRLPPQPKPSPMYSHVFEFGSLAGSYPEDGAADYLEGLSRKLCPK